MGDGLSRKTRDARFPGHASYGRTKTTRMDIDVLEAQLAHAKRGDAQKAYDRTTFDDDRRRVMQE